MSLNTIDYNAKTMIELKNICKENKIKGYSSNKFKTKENLINLLKGNIVYNKIINNLYDFLKKHYPYIIPMFDGDENDMKKIPKGTMVLYKWKCINYSICSNIFHSRPFELYRGDNKTRKYCNECAIQNRVLIKQQNMLIKNGSLLDSYPQIIDI